jgi:hypothetical protein
MSFQVIGCAEQTKKMIVAAGQTVTIPGYRTGYNRVVIGGDTTHVKNQPDGKCIFSEGEEVELPFAEADRLLALGLVIEPDSRQARSLRVGGKPVAPDGIRLVNAMTPIDGHITLSARGE